MFRYNSFRCVTVSIYYSYIVFDDLSIYHKLFLHLFYSILYVMYMYMIVIVHNPCISQPCQHGGECINATEGFACKCKGNHNGTTCSCRLYAVPVSVCYTFMCMCVIECM